MLMNSDGEFTFGRRAKTRGDVEGDILKYCKLNKKPFDVAYTEKWENKDFTATLGTPYDLGVDENLESELNRAFLYSVKFDAQGSELKRKFKKLLSVEAGKELDTKKSEIKFTSAMQVCIAVGSSLHRVFLYYEHDMSEQDKIKYLQQKSEVMLKVLMDVHRHELNLELVVSRMRAFTAQTMRPGYGRTVEINLNGKKRNVYDKKLNELYEKEVRRYFNHNTFVVSRIKMIYLPASACIYFNFGMNCDHARNCSEQDKWHKFWTHWCLQCGPQQIYDYDENEVHPLVACKHFRATWAPALIDPNWNNNSYTRPDMPRMIKYRQQNGRGRGRGRGGRGNSRGRGRGGRGGSNGGYNNNNQSGYHNNNNNNNYQGNNQSWSQGGNNEKPQGKGRGGGSKPQETKKEKTQG